MMNKKMKWLIASVVGTSLVLAGCGKQEVALEEKVEAQTTASEPNAVEIIAPHKDLNQEPVPLKVERVSENEVNVEMTAQITDIEIDKGYIYKAWTFNGEAPGPVI